MKHTHRIPSPLPPQTQKPRKDLESQITQQNIQANNLFSKLISHPYPITSPSNPQLQSDISNFFNLILSAQKLNPELVYQLFEMNAIEQIQEVHLNQYIWLFWRNYIIVLGNCKEGGIIALLFLQHRLPHLFIQSCIQSIGDSSQQSEQQEIVEYFGSYLKAYHRIFQPEWLNLFILQQQYFQLLQISLKFFNCPEPITRTTVFNIVLAILTHPQVHNFITKAQKRLPFYHHIADMMTQSFRNELVQLNQKIENINNKNTNGQTIVVEIDDKISGWEDLSRNCWDIKDIFKMHFAGNVLLPLLIDPIKSTSNHLFTLKFSLLIILKLLKTLKKFDLLQFLIQTLFISETIHYNPNSLHKAIVPRFSLPTILSTQIPETLSTEQNQSENIKKFYETVFKSKDNHFIFMSTNLITHLFSHLKESPTLLQKHNLQTHGPLNLQITSKLLNQLLETHHLLTIQTLLNAIVYINEQHPLESNNRNQFSNILKKIINQLKNTLKSTHNHWDHIVQANQYDIFKVSKISFGKLEDPKKFQQIFKIVFVSDLNQQQPNSTSFYSSIPDTINDNFRYLYVKFLLCRKAFFTLTSTPQQPNILTDYITRLAPHPHYHPSQIYPLSQLNSPTHICKILDGNQPIPSIWLPDENYFILAYFDQPKKQIKIILSIRYKYLSFELSTDRGRIIMKLTVKSLDPKTENIRFKNSLVVSGIEQFIMQITEYQIRVKEKQINFITNSIKKMQELIKNVEK